MTMDIIITGSDIALITSVVGLFTLLIILAVKNR